MPLTQHQTEIGEKVIEALHNGHKRIVLKGSAGVGKTFLTSELAKRFSRDYEINKRYNNGYVFLTTPTNKALSVLRNKVQGGDTMEFKTIHSALRIKMITNDKTGERYFKPDYSRQREDNFRDCRICIIDECSMLNTEFLGGTIYDNKGEPLREVEGYLENCDFPILFLGDDKQLNPVGEPYGSPVFNKDYPTFELTEIIRQGAGNPIIDLSRDLDLIYFKRPRIINGKGYVYDDNKSGLIDQLAEVNGTDEMKYLAYTNDEVDGMNALVRERIYGEPDRIEKGETLIFNSPLGNFYTNMEVKVDDLDIVTDYVIVPASNCKFDGMGEPVGPLDRIKMKFYRINDGFRVVHEHSDGMYNLISKTLFDNAKKYGWSWRAAYWFNEQFADITYNHAITMHKSQGSTYKTSIINIRSTKSCKNPAEKQRLLYTAVTRASDLIILNSV